MAKKIFIARDATVKNVKKCMIALDAKSQLNLLRLAVQENRSMSAVVRQLVNNAAERGRER